MLIIIHVKFSLVSPSLILAPFISARERNICYKKDCKTSTRRKLFFVVRYRIHRNNDIFSENDDLAQMLDTRVNPG